MTLPCVLPLVGSLLPPPSVGGPCDTPAPSQPLPGGLFSPFPVCGHPYDTFPAFQPFSRVSLAPSLMGYPCVPPPTPPFPFVGSPLHLSQEDSQGRLSHRLAFSKAFHNLPYLTLINNPPQPPVCRGG